MQERDRIILGKIVRYADDAIRFTDDMSFDGFMSDRRSMSAVAFCIGQMGELSRELSKETVAENPHIPWKSLYGMRNRIVHDYENISLTILWDTIRNDLPTLKKDIENILAQ